MLGDMRVAGIVALSLIPIVGVIWTVNAMESSLLRTDPAAIGEGTVLAFYARERGASVFENHCMVCHGKGGHGDPSKGIPDLTDTDWLYGTGRALDIEQTVTYGIRSHNARGWNLALMPAYARATPSPNDSKITPLQPEDIRDVIELLYHQESHAADEGAVRRGTAVYYGRGGCYDCHSADIKGDSAIGAPNLSDRITLYGDGSREALFQSIAYGRQGICPAWVGVLTPAQIREVALYVYSLSQSASSSHAD